MNTLVEMGLTPRQARSLEEHAARLAADAMGAEITVRTQDRGPQGFRNTTVTGRICEAAVERYRQAGRSVVAVFRITLECGPAKIRRGPYYVERLKSRRREES